MTAAAGSSSISKRGSQVGDFKMHLPAPRLQLRWRKATKAELRRTDSIWGQFNWTCDYELVLPLGENDIRRSKKHPEKVLRIGRTFMSTGRQTPPTEAPFRDGAHAHWDSEALGGVPVYVIGADGEARLQPNQKAAA